MMRFPGRPHGKTLRMSKAARDLVGMPKPERLKGSPNSCPWSPLWGDDWYCFYRHADWNGRMLQFKDTNCPFMSFSKYQFGGETSSWANHKEWKIRVFSSWTAEKGTRLWTEPKTSDSNWVGKKNNDKARSFQVLKCT